MSCQPLYFKKIHQPCNILPSQSHLVAWDWLICLLAKASLLFLSISSLVQEDHGSGLLVSTTCFLWTVQPWLFSTVSQLVLQSLPIHIYPKWLHTLQSNFLCLQRKAFLVYFDRRVRTWGPGLSARLGPLSFFLFLLPVTSTTFFCCLWHFIIFLRRSLVESDWYHTDVRSLLLLYLPT